MRRSWYLVVVLAIAGTSSAAPPDRVVDASFACVQPSVATSGRDGFVACGAGEAIFVARALDGGSFGPPQRIGSLTALALGHHRGPRVAATGATLVVTAIGRESATGTRELWAWRSSDRGGSWAGPVRVTDVFDAAQEGLDGLGASPAGVAVAWLDLRNGKMAIYGSTSADGGATWTKNVALYTSPGGAVCTCCHPSVEVDPGGTVSVMFRNDVDGNRDMYLKAGAAPAARLGDGHWRLSACPMDGGGMARSGDGRVLTTWRRDQTVFVAAPGRPETEVGAGKDPAIAFTGSEPVVAWSSPAGLAVRRGSAQPEIVDAAGHSPSLAGAADGAALLAWQRGDRSFVRRLAQSAASANSASTSSGPVTIVN